MKLSVFNGQYQEAAMNICLPYHFQQQNGKGDAVMFSYHLETPHPEWDRVHNHSREPECWDHWDWTHHECTHHPPHRRTHCLSSHRTRKSMKCPLHQIHSHLTPRRCLCLNPLQKQVYKQWKESSLQFRLLIWLTKMKLTTWHQHLTVKRVGKI